MSYFKTIRSHFFVLLFIALFIVYTYWNLPKTFFQQDEWETFAVNIYAQSNGLSGIVKSILPVDSLSHFNPLSRVFSLFQYFKLAKAISPTHPPFHVSHSTKSPSI